MMGDNSVLKNVLADILVDYFSTYDVKPFPINVLLVDDMWDGYVELRADYMRSLSNYCFGKILWGGEK